MMKKLSKVQELEANPYYIETYKACLENGISARDYVRMEFETITGKHLSVGTLYKWLAAYHKDIYNARPGYGTGKDVKEGRTQVARFTNVNGDVYVRTGHGWTKEYRAIMAPELIDATDDDLVVHHKDNNHFNNNPDNLVVMTRSEHSSLHMTEYWDEKLGR